MPKFIALTSRGLIDTLTEELTELGFKHLEKTGGGVLFESNWAGCYRANLNLRTATRVALTILDFPAYTPEDLYHNISKHDFTKYIPAHSTIAVDATTNSEIFRDQRFVAMKTKDAIVDQFYAKFGTRPDVDVKDPDLRVIIRVYDNEVSVAIDTSGDPLFKRGYRIKSVDAPLKEHLAAGLVKMTGWKGDVPLLDPMCGSGTFLIEGAMMAMGIAPSAFRKEFAFQRWETLQKDALMAEAEYVRGKEKSMPEGLLFGYDIDRKAVIAAQQNVKEAELQDYIQIRRSAVELIEPPEQPGIVIVNPPYGARLGEIDELKDVYRNLGFALKSKFKGWVAWVLSGEPELPALMSLKASRRVPVYNGNIECRFLRYEIR